ncbi:helix-turn-helix domain-containing protein [Streptomyces sp. NPDC052396]|uniref:helix-turn-helix domain-containing protein n=1 Tax=Streptomyces sp. NPDC052396 TaxID=3365689 RepID=UPI0037D39F4A
MKRKVGYTWKLREVMATQGTFTTTALVPLLRGRGIELSASQVHRLVSGTPERLSLQGPGRALRHLRLHPGRPGDHRRRHCRRPQDRLR